MTRSYRGTRYPLSFCTRRRGLVFCGGTSLVVGFVLILTQLGILPDRVHNLIGPGILLALGLWIVVAADREGYPPFDR